MTPTRRFNLISWGLTILLVLGAGAFTYWRLQPAVVTALPQATQASAQSATPAVASIPQGTGISMLSLPALGRGLYLKTVIPVRPRYSVLEHTVERGDSIFAISKQFAIKPETLLWANYEALEDDPHSLKPGQELVVPPADGILYKWKKGDTIDKIAVEYKAKSEDILSWPGNDLDLTNPQPKTDQLVMIPGGWRESKAMVIQTVTRGSSSKAGGGACGGGGAVGGGGFIFPTANHFVSGNDYFPGHPGIDLAATEGSPVYAADSGVVTMAAGGWNGGYGNVIMIDHGNGYATLYAHLSVIYVSPCQSVGQGLAIGAAGNTGNSFGAHLHFEVRQGGGTINPWYVLQ